MDFETRRDLYAACDPKAPLAPGDPRYVDLDAAGARGPSFADALAGRIELSDRPVMQLVTATPGAGLTTELHRVAARLGRKDGANLLVVRVDAERAFRVSEPFDVPEVLLPVIAAVEGAAAAAGVPVDALSRLARFLDIGGGRTPLDVVRNLPGAPVREAVRRRIDPELSSFVREVREEVARYRAEVQQRGYRGLAVIVDGLTKVRGLSNTWREVDHAAEKVFTFLSSYLELPAHTIYTLPIAVLPKLTGDVRVLPMIAVRDREGRPHEAGLAAAGELIRRRVPEEALGEIFGASVRAERLRALALGTGGVPRDMLRIVQQFIADERVDDFRFRQEISLETEIYRRPVYTSEEPWLRRVHETRSLATDGEDTASAAARSLSNGVVLPYEAAWWDVHPTVAERVLGIAPVENAERPAGA